MPPSCRRDRESNRALLERPPRPRSRLGEAVIVTVLTGCATSPGPARTTSDVGADLLGGSPPRPCVVADTSAPTSDTIFVIGVEPPRPDRVFMDCEHREVAASSRPTVVDLAPDSGVDLRDALDRGVPVGRGPRPDVVLTRDPDVIAYAARIPDYFVVPLAWNRTYVLLAGGTDSTLPMPADAERRALAGDAVTSDARGAEAPFAWLTDPGCSAPLDAAPATPRPIVVYAAGDAIARQLAERIVSLAGSRVRPAWLPVALSTEPSPFRVAAVDADSIPDALAGGRAAAGVVPLSRDWQTRCGTWTQPVAGRPIPLVDSRAHAIVRRGSGAAFTLGADGALWFVRRGAQ